RCQFPCYITILSRKAVVGPGYWKAIQQRQYHSSPQPVSSSLQAGCPFLQNGGPGQNNWRKSEQDISNRSSVIKQQTRCEDSSKPETQHSLQRSRKEHRTLSDKMEQNQQSGGEKDCEQKNIGKAPVKVSQVEGDHGQKHKKQHQAG